jgi:hypothetical protein
VTDSNLDRPNRLAHFHEFLQYLRAMRPRVESLERAVVGGGVNRRTFMTQSGAAFASVAAIKTAFAETVKHLAPPRQIDDGYWEKIRKNFLLEDGLAYLNNGTVGPTPDRDDA